MASDQERVLAVLDALPIFPLPSAVLLPYEVMPLHVFEPRYRALVEHVVAHGAVLGVVQLAPGWEGDYEGRPPVEPVCGAGLVVQHEKLADGRYNILLRGLARVRITGELPPTRPWREVRGELFEDAYPPGGPHVLDDELDVLREALLAFCAARPGPASNALAHLAAQAPGTAALVDIVLAALLTDPTARHRALYANAVSDRIELVRPAIAELLAAHVNAGVRN